MRRRRAIIVAKSVRVGEGCVGIDWYGGENVRVSAIGVVHDCVARVVRSANVMTQFGSFAILKPKKTKKNAISCECIMQGRKPAKGSKNRIENRSHHKAP
jgi:hypothetical protein